MPGYKLNNATCATSCQPGFGATSNPLVCVWCNLKCASSACTNVFDNCTACTSTAPYTAFLTTIGTPYPKCLSTCLAGQYANSTDQKCHLCDSSCITCVNTSTTCYECSNSAGWLNYACFAVCADGYFLESNQVNSNKVNCPTCYNCTLCSSVCLTCTGLSTKCTACPTSGANAAYLLGNSCVGTCPNGYYKDNNGGLGPNICASCSVGCKVCINNAINCTLCITGYFFYRYTCSLTCPSGFYGNIPSSMCLSETGYAVNMTMKMYFTDSSKSTINVDITFTKAMDFTTFNMSSFQTYSIINSPNSLNTAITPAMFSYNYTATNSSSYLITITPIGYLYLNNITFVVTTIVQPTTGQFAADGTQLNPNVYQVSQSLLWYFVKSANLSGP